MVLNTSPVNNFVEKWWFINYVGTIVFNKLGFTVFKLNQLSIKLTMSFCKGIEKSNGFFLANR